jgi:hypothetical protein
MRFIEMGADNQADRVVRRIEYREELAAVFYRAYQRKWPHRIAWEALPPMQQAAYAAGVAAVIEQINEDIDGQQLA